MKYKSHVKYAIICFSLSSISCAQMNLNSSHVAQIAFFTNATAADESKCLNAERSDLELACHRLRKDNNIILAVRIFSSSSDHHSDHFKKLTIQLPGQPKESEVYTIDENAKAFFSYGLTYGLGKVGCYGVAKSGTIQITYLKADEIVSKIDIIFSMKNLFRPNDRCKEEIFSNTITAKYKPFESLTAWDGIYKGKSNEIQEARP